MPITSSLQIPKRVDTLQLIRDANQSDKEQLHKLIDNCFLEGKYRDVIYQNLNDIKIVNNPLLQERFKY
jgi:N-acetylglutamate synthase-like GNAT family acetyltransferase